MYRPDRKDRGTTDPSGTVKTVHSTSGDLERKGKPSVVVRPITNEVVGPRDSPITTYVLRREREVLLIVLYSSFIWK